MELKDQLRQARRAAELTQAQAAEALEVAVEQIDAWESGDGQPGRSQIQKLAACYNCPAEDFFSATTGSSPNQQENGYTHYEEPTPAPRSAADQAQLAQDFAEYVSEHKRFALFISAGVALVLLGVTALLACGPRLEAGLVSEGLAVAGFLLLVAIATFFFIYSGIRYGDFQTSHPYIEDLFDPQEIRQFHRAFAWGVGGAVFLILAGVIALILLNTGYFGATLLLGCVTLSSTALVWLGMTWSGYDISTYNKERRAERKPKNDRVSSIIMLTATAVFLICGFLFNAWHPAWIVFPIGGILCGIVEHIMGDAD